MEVDFSGKNSLKFVKTMVFTKCNYPVTDQWNATFSEWQIAIILNRIDTSTKLTLVTQMPTKTEAD